MDTVERMFELVDRKYEEQRQFATDLNVPASRVSEWRTGKSASYNKRLHQIAKVLNTSVEYLLTGENKEPATVSGELPDILVKYKSLAPDDQDEVLAIIEMKLAKKNKAP